MLLRAANLLKILFLLRRWATLRGGATNHNHSEQRSNAHRAISMIAVYILTDCHAHSMQSDWLTRFLLPVLLFFATLSENCYSKKRYGRNFSTIVLSEFQRSREGRKNFFVQTSPSGLFGVPVTNLTLVFEIPADYDITIGTGDYGHGHRFRPNFIQGSYPEC